MTKEKLSSRTRMQPEDRKENILSHAAALVINEGVTAVTIDRVRQLADVSRSLIYNYYKDTNELLISLFEQERKNFRKRQEKAVSKARSFEEMVRLTIRTTLQYYHANGKLIARLTNEPAIANAVLQTEEEVAWRDKVERYYAKQFVERYRIPEDIAIITFQILEGLAESAGLRVVGRLGEDGIEFIEEITYAANMASLRAIGRKYGEDNGLPPIDEQWLEEAQSIVSSISNVIEQRRAESKSSDDSPRSKKNNKD